MYVESLFKMQCCYETFNLVVIGTGDECQFDSLAFSISMNSSEPGILGGTACLSQSLLMLSECCSAPFGKVREGFHDVGHDGTLIFCCEVVAQVVFLAHRVPEDVVDGFGVGNHAVEVE